MGATRGIASRSSVSASLFAVVAALASGAACNGETTETIITNPPPVSESQPSFGLGPATDDDGGVIILPSPPSPVGVVTGAPVAGDFSSCTSEDPSTLVPGSADASAGQGGPGVVFLGGVALPAFTPTVTAAVAPPPVSGGTLLALANGKVAVASDPDRDAVYVIDTVNGVVRSTISLQAGDEPGRAVEDSAGQVHVALRSGGALVTIDPSSGLIVTRRTVCPAPRGVAWDSTTNSVWVACATGELVALPAAGGPATKSFVVERDLRDVLVDGAGALTVTEFRSAQILHLARDGSVLSRSTLPTAAPLSSAQVLWRAVLTPSHSILAAYQGQSLVDVQTNSPSAYGSGAAGPFGIVSSQMATMDDSVDAAGVTEAAVLTQSVLPVDVAISPDGSYAAVLSAGGGFSLSAPEVSFMELHSGSCAFSQPPPINVPSFEAGPAPGIPSTPEQPIAVAFDGSGHLLVQMREPASLRILPAPACASMTSSDEPQGPLFNPIGGTVVSLSSISRADTGHDIFHATAGFAIACASCHPEGGDDGHVWILDGNARRTPSLRGTIEGTAPYHWPGDEPDFPTLTANVYTGRMGGGTLQPDQTSALMQWVQAIPAPPAPSWLDSAAVMRGSAVFARSDTQCTTCHSGPKLTDNKTLSVGTCGLFQVPPLVGLGWRAPFMHNGCAATLADRFGKCATAGHGSVTQLADGDVSDLVAYLESL